VAIRAARLAMAAWFRVPPVTVERTGAAKIMKARRPRVWRGTARVGLARNQRKATGRWAAVQAKRRPTRTER
jgi:hypothetical protein